MSKTKYRIEITKNLINNKQILEEYIKESVFNIVWLDRTIFYVGEFFSDIRELKRKYHGQSYFYYPIMIDNNSDLILTDEEHKQGYIIVSKREYRTKYKYLRYETNREVEESIDNDLQHFIKNVNSIIHGNTYQCKVYLTKGNILVDDIKDILADSEEELKRKITERTKIPNEEVFETINQFKLIA